MVHHMIYIYIQVLYRIFLPWGELDSMNFSTCIVCFAFPLVLLLSFIWQWFFKYKKETVFTYIYVYIYICYGAKYGFGPSEDFAAQTSDLSFCAIILGSRMQTSDPRFCCANLGSARNLLGSSNQTSAIHSNKPTINRARKAARPSASTKPRSIAHAKQFGHPRQRSHDRSHTQSSSAIRGNEPMLPQMAELLCVCDRSWVCCRGWPRFGCAILDDCVRIRGLRVRS